MEHTNINPNKAAHIGHLRNAVLGDTFARLLRSVGERVEVQNYIDDTGVQVADVVVGFKYLEKKTLEEIKALPGKFDYYCWDLYARVSSFYEAAPENRDLRGANASGNRGRRGRNRRHCPLHFAKHCPLPPGDHESHRRCLRPAPQGERYSPPQFLESCLPTIEGRQGDPLRNRAEGTEGCWVMRAGEIQPARPGPLREPPPADLGHEEDKIIVRSNGTVTYVGKDIAYQLWKLGLLGMDFFYRPFHTYPERPSGHDDQTPTPTGTQPNPDFGQGERVYNVIDSRQSYLQNIVVTGLRALGFHRQADRSISLLL